tara:strand:+ start:80 stop:643 length:564 start_codon:yes stop_codon:yes gene_type:complete
MATLNTTNIKHASSSSNNIVLAADGSTSISGHIIQTVNSHLKTRQTITGSSSFQTTGLSATITPSSSSSKILVVVNGVYNVANLTSTQYISQFKLYNGTTEITDANSTGSTNNAWKTMFEVSAQSGNHQHYELLPIQGDYLYTHGGSAGSAITINLYAQCASAMFFNGRNLTDYGTTSSMTLHEIAA